MKAFVTGANGFIGSNLVQTLVLKGHSVTGLVLPKTNIKNIQNKGCEIVEGNILEIEGFEKYLKNIDVLFHLAGKVSDWGKWNDFYKLNVQATKNLLEKAVKQKVKRIVFVSSLAIHKPHGHGFKDGNEDAPRDNRNNPYALSKIMAEDLIYEFYKKGSIETVIIRPGVFPFGPQDRTSFFHIARAMEKGAFCYINKGERLLCTAYIENLIDGILLASEKSIANGKVYIISDNIKITWRELIELFAKYLNIKPPKITLPFWFAKPVANLMEVIYKLLLRNTSPPLTTYRVCLVAKNFFFSSEKAISELGYNPSVSIEEGVKRTVQWYKSLVS